MDSDQIRNVVLPITGGGASGGSLKQQRRDYMRGVNHGRATRAHHQDLRWAEVPMTFTLDDTDGVKFPHTNALVGTVNIADIEVR